MHQWVLEVLLDILFCFPLNITLLDLKVVPNIIFLDYNSM